MSDPMPIRDEDISRIGDYVKPWLRELVTEMVPGVGLAGLGPQLMERMIRVEEELKSQRELMDERFRAVDRRFEDLITNINKRFNNLTWMIGIGFVVITSLTTVFALLA